MTRTPVPDEFREETVASPASVKYARDLLRQKDLFKNSQWFDRCNAMDAEEYASHLDSIEAAMATWDQPKVSKTIDWLKKLPWLPRGEQQHVGSANRDLPTPEELPAGSYAVEAESGELRFYRLWRGTRNPNYVKLYVQHGPDSSEVEWKAVPTILKKIVAAGSFEAAVRYGREIGSCAICGTRLTNTISRELGIGPVCGRRFWVDDPDQWTSIKREARNAILDRGEDPDSTIA